MANKAAATDNEIVITEHGRRPGAALITRVEYESFRETLNILSDPDMMAGIEEAESDIEAGRLIELPQAADQAEPGRTRPRAPAAL